ncbi:type II toxin-antitoxin system RelE/ParE family toxin [Microbacterium sp.]|uniref:type II toxin-antitoxin system RelE family toxin n=1 Tax=Microbacterium sp. TaxID=51671 RepID=UPI001ACC9197|nr:type II toxin-antitoxin system RelE/ParE family toxin [Microbacterium sp.]MBN9157371.1 type II toxin-antitoxin system RelE/ParE family toxin [Microbacterium sp.]MBS1900064.1 type II toxin-antitoxin system RelE/ParE family toxin [Actinomycetota bacterium]
MSFSIEIAPAARRQLRKLEPLARRRIQAAIELLADEPRPPAAKPLVNSDGAWRVRIGDYRVIYDIQDGRLIVLVLAVGHRREIYRER